VVSEVLSRGARSCAPSALPGLGFLAPTSTVDTPEAAENEKRKERVVDLGAHAENHWKPLGVVTAALYKEGKGESGVSAAAACEVGMMVRIAGVIAVLGKPNGGIAPTYFNAGSATPLSSADCAFSSLAKAFGGAGLAKTTATLLSMSSHGFFGAQLSEEQDRQAQVFRDNWTAHLESIQRSLENMQAGASGALLAGLEALSACLAEAKPAQVAAGAQMLPVNEEYSAPAAAILVEARHPWKKTPPAVEALMEGNSNLPETFAACVVSGVEKLKSTGYNLTLSLALVGSKTQAEKDFAAGKNPLLVVPGGAAFTTSLKQFPPIFGTNVVSKLEIATQELLPFAAFATAVTVGAPAQVGQETVCGFARAPLTVDLKATLQKAAVLVSDGFVKTVLFECGNIFVEDEVPSEKMPGDTPTYMADGFQECTRTCKIANLAKEGTSREWRVVYDGSSKNLTEQLVSSSEAGEAHLKDMAAAVEKDLRSFLARECLIYALSVPN
jgi:hypothetical protein